MAYDRSVNILGGNVQGVISTGDNANIVQSPSEYTHEISDEISEVLEQLSKKYSGIPESQKQLLLQIELQQKVRNDPTFRQRFLSALKSGSLELIKVITNNPFISVPLETVKGWIEVGPS
jgi:hypothetical protein